MSGKGNNDIKVVLHNPFLRIEGSSRFQINVPNHNSGAVVH